MLKVLTSEEMREVDRLSTTRYGIPSLVLMENAAHATARIIEDKLGGCVSGNSFLIVCGKGNNGGDGAALARILAQQGGLVNVFLFGRVEETKGDARTNFEILRSLSERSTETEITFVEKSTNSTLSDELISTIEHSNGFDVFVDALFGTGLTRPIDEWISSTIELAIQFLTYKDSFPLRLAIDIPSGLDANRISALDRCLQNDFTVTFTAPKLANVLPPASNLNGEVSIVSIGSPQELIDESPSKTYLVEIQDARDWLKRTGFSDDSYKSKRGNVSLVVGSKRYAGAAVLAGNGAMLSGAGLVTVITSQSALPRISERILAEVMVSGVSETSNGAVAADAFEEILELASKSDVLAIGSGLDSSDESTQNLVGLIAEKRKTPIVIDADGLNAISPFKFEGSKDYPIVLTPHKGEFLRLLGKEADTNFEDRVDAVRVFAQYHQVVLVLKGERTLIAGMDGTVVIVPTGNSGLGKAGNGDNLTGVISGFIAQGLQSDVEVFESVVAAVFIAGMAGDIAKEKFGERVMLASDVRDCMVDAFREVEASK